MTSGTHFYTVADSSFFPGFVGLYNSHCDIADLSGELTTPMHQAAFAARFEPKGIVVVIDSDIIVTRSLDELLERSAAGRICVSLDFDLNRFFPEWQAIFNLSRPLRRLPYINAGVVVFSADRWPDFLQEWWSATEKVKHEPHVQHTGNWNDPVSQADQDALNAILMANYGFENIHLIPHFHLATRPFFDEVRVRDLTTLECTYCGMKPYMLHATASPKPWSAELRDRGRSCVAYRELLRRLLTARDVPIRVPDEMLVPWLRSSTSGGLYNRYFAAIKRVRRSFA
jgi:hypothetical protein